MTVFRWIIAAIFTLLIAAAAASALKPRKRPPTEVQSVLVPTYVLRGEVNTEQLPRYEFIAYVAATELGEADAKRKRWQQVRPSLLTA